MRRLDRILCNRADGISTPSRSESSLSGGRHAEDPEGRLPMAARRASKRAGVNTHGVHIRRHTSCTVGDDRCSHEVDSGTPALASYLPTHRATRIDRSWRCGADELTDCRATCPGALFPPNGTPVPHWLQPHRVVPNQWKSRTGGVASG